MLCFIAQCASDVTAAPNSFQCPGVGIFPDPTDCHNFYTCDSSLVPNLGTCMNGTGTYDADSKVCRVTPCSGPPTPAVTTPPTFACPAVGLFADPTSCHNYYACDQDLNAIPGTCMKGNWTFDPVNQVCTTAPCPGTGTFVCPSSGIFADPADCHGFYVCDANLNPIESTCTASAYFDPTRICIVGPCVQSSPTTPPVPVSNTPFQCTAVGYFADPADCHSYYACDSLLTASHHTCMGGGGYFDPYEVGCYYGDCY